MQSPLRRDAETILAAATGRFAFFRAVLALGLPLIGAGLARAQVLVPWLGGSGAWNDSLRWVGGVLPNNLGLLHFGASIAAGDAHVSSDVTIDYLSLTGGTIYGPGNLTLNGPFTSTWSGGSLSGTGEVVISATGALTISGSGSKVFDRRDGNTVGGHTIRNAGTITVTGTGDLLGGDGGQIINTGLFDLQQEMTIGYSGSGASPTFTNSGTLQKSGSEGAVVFTQLAFNNTGLVSVQVGSITFEGSVASTGGTFQAGPPDALIVFLGGQSFTGTTFSGEGLKLLSDGVTTLNGNIAANNLRFAGGTLQGTATVTGAMDWTGGSWSGTGTLTLGVDSVLNFLGASNKVFDRADGNTVGGRTIENFGQIVWTGSGQLLGGDGAQIINRTGAQFQLINTSTLDWAGYGAQPTFNNQGLFVKTEIGGTTTVSRMTFLNSGEVRTDAGTLNFTAGVISSGGLFDTASGTSMLFSGGQNFQNGALIADANGPLRILSGDTVLAGSITMQNVEFAGGNLYGDATIAGSLNWTGGLWRGASTLDFAAGSMLTLSGSADKSIARADGNVVGGRVVRSAGTINWQDTGQILGYDGAGIQILTGGLLQISNSSTYKWGGSGALPFLINGGTVRKVAGGTTTLDGVLFTNNDTVQIQAGTLLLTGGGGLANNHLFQVQSGTVTSSANGATSTGGTFDVFSGSLLRFTGGTNTIVNSGFTGGGLTEVAGGTLAVTGAPGSTITGTLQLSSGTIGGDGNLTVSPGGAFAWTGGNLIGTGTLTIAGLGQMTIDGPAVKLFYRGDGNTVGGRTITNAGLVTWMGLGSLLGGDGATFVNQVTGTFEIGGNATFDYAGVGAGPGFFNTGLVRKSGGGGTTDFAEYFQNDGSVQGQNGTVRFSGGGAGSGEFNATGGTIEFTAAYAWNDGARITGSGTTSILGATVTVPGGTVRVGSATTDGFLALQSGGINGGGLLVVGGLGRMDWTGGGISGTGTLQIAAGGQLNLIGSGDHDFYRGDGNTVGGRTIENFGTVHWLAGNLLGGDGGQILNRPGGVIDIQGAGRIGWVEFGAPPTLINDGTFRKSAGGTTTVDRIGFTTTATGLVDLLAGNLTFEAGVTSTGGTINAASGTTLTFHAGQSFSGTTFTGGGTMQATGGATTLDGTISASHLLLAGGSLYGTSTFSTGTLEWTGGLMRGTGTLTIAPGATLLISGTGDRTLDRGDGNTVGGRIIENRGTVQWTGGNLLGGDGAQIINQSGALFNLQGTGTLGWAGYGATLAFTNAGTFRKSSAGTTTVDRIGFTTTGLVEVQAGTLNFESGVTSTGGTFSAASGTTITFNGGQSFSGTTFTGAGTMQATGGATTLDGAISASHLLLAGGNVYGTSTFSTGTLEWTGGVMHGPGTLTIASGATLQLSGAGDRMFDRGDSNVVGGRIIENRGFLRVENTGNLVGSDGAQIINRSTGLVELRNNTTIASGSGAGLSMTNEGTFMKSQGTGTSTVAVPFSNTGTIAGTSGTLAFTSSFTNTNGNLSVIGGTVSFANNYDSGTGVIGGSGTIIAPNVNVSGFLSPGVSTGTLAITGNLSLLATSTFLLEIGGGTQGTGYDFLNVSGTAMVGGNLAISLTNGFTPTGGATFTVLTSTGLSGAFANVANGARVFTADHLTSFQVNYGLGSGLGVNSVVLSNFSAVPEPSTWALMIAGGVMAGAWGWRRRGGRGRAGEGD